MKTEGDQGTHDMQEESMHKWEKPLEETPPTISDKPEEDSHTPEKSSQEQPQQNTQASKMEETRKAKEERSET